MWYHVSMKSWFSRDIGIDMGSSRVRVFVPNKGVVFDEPNYLVFSKADNRLVSWGESAKEARERTAPDLLVHHIMDHGLILDQKRAIEYIRLMFSEISGPFALLRKDVLSNTPTDVPNVDLRTFMEVFRRAGARNVFLEQNAILAAFGIGMRKKDLRAWMVVDIGAGLTDIGVISLGGLSSYKSVKVAGDDMDGDIVEYVKKKFSLIISKEVAEKAKKQIGSSSLQDDKGEFGITGSDAISKLPRSMQITSKEIAEAIQGSLMKIVEAVGSVFQETPPEITSDILEQGIVLSGGTAKLHGISQFISTHINAPVYVVDDPEYAVIRGIGKRIQAGHVQYHKQQLLSFR